MARSGVGGSRLEAAHVLQVGGVVRMGCTASQVLGQFCSVSCGSECKPLGRSLVFGSVCRSRCAWGVYEAFGACVAGCKAPRVLLPLYSPKGFLWLSVSRVMVARVGWQMKYTGVGARGAQGAMI